MSHGRVRYQGRTSRSSARRSAQRRPPASCPTPQAPGLWFGTVVCGWARFPGGGHERDACPLAWRHVATRSVSIPPAGRDVSAPAGAAETPPNLQDLADARRVVTLRPTRGWVSLRLDEVWRYRE